MPRFLIVVFTALLLFPGFAAAHALNQSYVYFQVTQEGLTGRIEVILEDIDKALALDADGDGEITAAEFEDKAEEAFDLLTKDLQLSYKGRPLDIRSTGFGTFGGGTALDFAVVAQMEFAVDGLDTVPEAIDMSYVFLFDRIDPAHVGYALIEENFRTGIAENERFVSLVFTNGATQRLSLVGQPWTAVVANSVVNGIWHIWLGFDHLLFLATVLIASVVVAQSGRWAPQETFGQSFGSLARGVTVFCVAQGIGLVLGALGIVRVPLLLLEFLIAISIIVLALDLIFPVFHRRIWLALLGFGVVHGLAFAASLIRLGIDPQHKIVTLLGFDAGIIFGVIVLMAMLFPVVYVMRTSSFFRPVFLIAIPCILIVVGSFWTVQRFPGMIEGVARIADRGTLVPPS